MGSCVVSMDSSWSDNMAARGIQPYDSSVTRYPNDIT